MTGEEIAVASDRLRTAPGVLDVTIGQVQGKKGRLMQCLRLLVQPERTEAVDGRCFAETSTIGLRLAEEQRAILPRQLSRRIAADNAVGVKIVERGGRASVKAESDDLVGDDLDTRRRLKRLVEKAERADQRDSARRPANPP